MTTQETIDFIRQNITVDNFMFGYGADKFCKGWVKGLITMASLQMIISYSDTLMLERELEEAIKQANSIKQANEIQQANAIEIN
jgi:hypothetical protein